MSINISGIIAFPTNPGTCGVMGLLQSGGAFATTAITGAMALKDQLLGSIERIQEIPEAILTSLMLDAQSLIMRIEAVAMGAVSALISHLQTQIQNLVSNLSLAVSHLAAQVGLVGAGCNMPSQGNTGAPGTDPCAGMGNFFGSLMGGAQGFIDQITSQINAMTSTIQNVVSGVLTDMQAALGAIMGAVAQIEMVAANITTMIGNEVQALATAMTEMLNFAMTNSLFSLFQNPCAKQVLNAVGTPELLGHLGASG